VRRLSKLPLAAALLAGPLAAQQGTVGIAVLPLENTGSYGQDKEVFEALELGLAAMLASSLARHPGVDIPEYGRQSEALKAAGLGPRQRLDAATAAQVGKALGSRYVVTGSFADFYGKFRINARVIDAATGDILKVVSNDDPKLQDRAQLWAIIQRLDELLAKAADLPPAPPGGSPAIATDAITSYSRGLLYETRGDRAKAVDYYRRALTSSPGYSEAQAGLTRLGAS
jgi:TolB-like protein